jgi:hypothetical protein
VDIIISMSANHKAQVHHVYLGERRTTVTLDDSIAFFLALKLGLEPRTAEAKAAIREWLQDQLDEQDDPDRVSVSQWLRFQAIRYLVDRKLSTRYEHWLDEQLGYR